MIAKKHRFHGHKSVSRVRGSKISSTQYNVYYSMNSKRSDYRMAVVVSKKISKKAVTRNRIRRRLFEAVRKSRALEGYPYDVVFVVRSVDIAKEPADHLEMSVNKTCAQITERG